MTNDAFIRCVKGNPSFPLTVDAQSGTAGLETRIESFIDILRYQKSEDISVTSDNNSNRRISEVAAPLKQRVTEIKRPSTAWLTPEAPLFRRRTRRVFS